MNKCFRINDRLRNSRYILMKVHIEKLSCSLEKFNHTNYQHSAIGNFQIFHCLFHELITRKPER